MCVIISWSFQIVNWIEKFSARRRLFSNFETNLQCRVFVRVRWKAVCFPTSRRRRSFQLLSNVTSCIYCLVNFKSEKWVPMKELMNELACFLDVPQQLFQLKKFMLFLNRFAWAVRYDDIYYWPAANVLLTYRHYNVIIAYACFRLWLYRTHVTSILS